MVLEVVREAERRLLADRTHDHEYLPMGGIPAFCRLRCQMSDEPCGLQGGKNCSVVPPARLLTGTAARPSLPQRSDGVWRGVGGAAGGTLRHHPGPVRHWQPQGEAVAPCSCTATGGCTGQHPFGFSYAPYSPPRHTHRWAASSWLSTTLAPRSCSSLPPPGPTTAPSSSAAA